MSYHLLFDIYDHKNNIGKLRSNIERDKYNITSLWKVYIVIKFVELRYILLRYNCCMKYNVFKY